MKAIKIDLAELMSKPEHKHIPNGRVPMSEDEKEYLKNILELADTVKVQIEDIEKRRKKLWAMIDLRLDMFGTCKEIDGDEIVIFKHEDE